MKRTEKYVKSMAQTVITHMATHGHLGNISPHTGDEIGTLLQEYAEMLRFADLITSTAYSEHAGIEETEG